MSDKFGWPNKEKESEECVKTLGEKLKALNTKKIKLGPKVILNTLYIRQENKDGLQRGD